MAEKDSYVRTANSDNGRITLPKPLRERYGETYEITEEDDTIKLVPLAPVEE